MLARELRAAMELNPRLAVFVAEYLARSKRSAERRVLRAMTQSVDRRVIETLVELAGSFGARCPHGFSLEIRLTQQDIADLVGASRPVVSSILSGLRKRGLLNYTRDMICVNDSALSLFARSFVDRTMAGKGDWLPFCTSGLHTSPETSRRPGIVWPMQT